MLFCVAIILSSSQKPGSPRWQTTKYIIWLHRLTEFNQRSERNRTKNGCVKTRLRNESSCFAEKMHRKTLKREKKNAEPNGRNIERIYLNVHSDCIRNMSATGSKIFFHSEYNFFLFIFVELFELVAVAHPIRFFYLFHSFTRFLSNRFSHWVPLRFILAVNFQFLLFWTMECRCGFMHYK